ncbi:MAG: hypothetical protein ACR2PA_19090 [Hyphomicrobiaceae bacterium]
MVWKFPVAICAALAFGTLSAFAQNSGVPQGWQPVPKLLSSNLAKDGWEIRTSSGLSWPDGKQAIYSYWSRLRDGKLSTILCAAYFRRDRKATGETCFRPPR